MQRRVQEEPAGAMRPHSSGMWVPSPQRKPERPYRKVVRCLRMENTLGMRAVPLYLSVAALTWSRAVPPHSLTTQRRRCPCRGAGNQVHRAGVGCQGRAEAGLVVCRQDCMWHLGFFLVVWLHSPRDALSSASNHPLASARVSVPGSLAVFLPAPCESRRLTEVAGMSERWFFKQTCVQQKLPVGFF